MRPAARIDCGHPAPSLVADTTLEQAIHNLINNAADACPEGVECEAGSDGEQLVVRVLDRGPGIPESEIERMRQPFTRLEKARSNTKGAGLGLAIVDRVIRAHHGRLELSARAGGGLCAALCLPLAAPAGEQDRMRRSAHSEPDRP